MPICTLIFKESWPLTSFSPIFHQHTCCKVFKPNHKHGDSSLWLIRIPPVSQANAFQQSWVPSEWQMLTTDTMSHSSLVTLSDVYGKCFLPSEFFLARMNYLSPEITSQTCWAPWDPCIFLLSCSHFSVINWHSSGPCAMYVYLCVCVWVIWIWALSYTAISFLCPSIPHAPFHKTWHPPFWLGMPLLFYLSIQRRSHSYYWEGIRFLLWHIWS